MQIKKMDIKRVNSGLYQANAWIVSNAISRDAILIDCGEEGELLIQFLNRENLKPVVLLATHIHPDHIGAAELIRKHFQIPFMVHSAEKKILTSVKLSAPFLGFNNFRLSKVDWFIEADQVLHYADYRIQILHTPGHTPGSVCYLINHVLFSGDTLFQTSVGRVDLPGGSWEQLQQSLRQLMKLPAETAIYPGHGAISSIKAECKQNPFIKNLCT
jgi:glyoxylase-like metal-dependent hydrolase (beta-lactamase superfamily II)